jgi:hypothetical protein
LCGDLLDLDPDNLAAFIATGKHVFGIFCILYFVNVHMFLYILVVVPRDVRTHTITSPTRRRPHWFNEVQEDVATDGIPSEQENVPGILLGKKINGDVDEYRNCFGKRMRAPTHPSNFELLTTVSMNGQSFILSYRILCYDGYLFHPQEKFNSEEVKSLELVIGGQNDRITSDHSRTVSGKNMRPPSNPANLGLDITESMNYSMVSLVFFY